MLKVHRAERGDGLVEGLAELLRRPLDDPFTAEIVAVPTRGIERWLTQQLSGRLGAGEGRGDGVCANVDFPFPGRLVGQALAAATGADPRRDPWSPERAVWPLLDVVDAHLHEAWLSTLRAHLAGASDGRAPTAGWVEAHAGRRFAAVRRIADLFDRYGVHRPAMLRAWAAGDDSDGLGQPLPPDLAWQPILWRLLRQRLGAPGPAERLVAASGLLRAHPERLDWPPRLSLFGLTRLPASYLDVLCAVAADRDVHLWLLHPSPALWERIAALPAADRAVGSRRRDRSASQARNPLLATWARDAREMQLVLSAATQVGSDELEPVEPAPPTLLGHIQAGVRADRAVSSAEPESRHRLAAGDHSLQVHSCHGRARQVEVLRSAILHLLADDPTLEPRDVIVMCPDIDAFAPLIHATFDFDEATAAPDGAWLPVRLADRSLRQTNPMLDAVSQLLRLAHARVTASEVIDFAGLPPVRRRFRFTDDDLARLNEWAAASGVRWGLDGRHRQPWLLEGVDAGTWAAGLQRILVGVAMSGDDRRLMSGVLPLDDVEGSDIDLAGRLGELVDRLGDAIDGLRGPQAVTGWTAALRSAADGLCETGDRDDWQGEQLHGLLDAVGDEAGRHASTTRVSLGEIESLLADRLRGRPTRANFRTGSLTMCTMVPMRSVPHRVVCLVGLDDGVFPRRTAPDGDDLIGRDPWIGDQDPRSEDRQLLLDALLAATDTLVITYAGRDERTNAPRPPAVPLGELLDVVDRTVTTDERDSGGGFVAARRRVVIEHPLQPFDPRNFTAGALVGGRPWAFDPAALAGAQASAATRRVPPPFLAVPLPASHAETTEVDDLLRFVAHPVRAFLRSRLGVSLSSRDDDPADALPIELDALEKWTVGDRLLEAGLAGVEESVAVAAERGRGTLPPGVMGQRVLDEIVPRVTRLHDAARAHGAAGPSTSIDVAVDVAVAPRRSLAGTVDGVVGDVVRTVTYSKLAAKHRLAAWVRLLALTASRPQRPWQSVVVARGDGQLPDIRRIGPLGATPEQRASRARMALGALLDLYDRGMCEPLPLYGRTSAAYAQGRHDGGDGVAEARREWETATGYHREDGDLEHQLVLGGRPPFAALLRGAAGGGGVRGGMGERRRPPVRTAGAPAVGRAAGQRGRRAMTRRPPSTFDVTGPLPWGLTVLEASAGTGKTLAVAALVARYVAEGVPLEELLVVTFTRMATGQLRARVRDRLVSAEAGLQRRLEGAPARSGRRGARTPRRRRRRPGRVPAATAEHGAGRLRRGDDRHHPRVLRTRARRTRRPGRRRGGRHLRRGHRRPGGRGGRRSLRPARPAPRPSRLQPGRGGRDRRRGHGQPGDARRPRARPRRLGLGPAAQAGARRARRSGAAQTAGESDDLRRPPVPAGQDARRPRPRSPGLRPAAGPLPGGAGRRVPGHRPGAVGHPAPGVRRRRQHPGAHRGPQAGHLQLPGRRRLRLPRCRVLGPDARPPSGPTGAATTTSSPPPAPCSPTPGWAIPTSPSGRQGRRRDTVSQASVARARDRRCACGSCPARIRTVELTRKGYVAKNSGEQHVAEDLAADVLRLVGSGTELLTRDEEGQVVSAAPIRPGHVAVLVRTNRQATRVRDALDDAGVPAVVSGAGSVFAARVAQDWLRLLEALERPASTGRIRTVALTSFVGWSAARLAASDDTELEALQAEVQGWSALLERRGVASLLETVSRNRSLARRLLAQSGGERQLTDLRHIGQLLHGESTDGRLGPAALASWLRRRIAEAGSDAATEERSRRLESDAEAVQVLTVHRSKGLEFPITYVPYLWTDQSVDQRPPVYHDPADRHRRKVDVGGQGGPDLEPHKRQRDREERGEDLRLAYVALTRARHAVVCWWAASWGSRMSPLGRLLFGRDADGAVADKLKQPPGDADAVARLQELAAASGGRIAVEMGNGRPREAPGEASGGGPRARCPALRP